MGDSVVMEVADLTRQFGEVTVLDRFTFSLKRGEILGLLGANGAGKTTAMNMLLGLTTPTSGSIKIFGKDLDKHRVEVLGRMNFCSAYTALPGNLTVWQNLRVFARIYGVKQPQQRIEELLKLLDITELKHRVTGQLSAGEGTRVNLCKALLNSPELLLLDEPTASLDPDIADKVRKFVRKMQREHGIAILYTSHNMLDIEEVCDRVIFLHKGKVVQQGTPEEIKARSQTGSLEEVFIKIARNGEIED
jgi:ABC-2 type transport system ATP-binding protein